MNDMNEQWELTTRKINGFNEDVIETPIGNTILYGYKLPLMKHIMDCHNAMLGHDPATVHILPADTLAKVREALEAALKVGSALPDTPACEQARMKLRAALAALDVQP